MTEQQTKENQPKTYKYNPKPLFEERMNSILELSGHDEKDKKAFWEIVHKEPIDSIRCNTLKISADELRAKLEARGWKINQPYKESPEIMIIDESTNLKPGELGKAEEHILGYFYVQEISSMMPVLALNPDENDSFLDLCASPGSKTTQAASHMKNSGILVANDNKLGRMIILCSNLEKCGVSNAIITRKDGVQLCKRLAQEGYRFDKVLVDAPCSGEGTLRSSPRTFISWNIKTVENLASTQKMLAANALEIVKDGGEMIYSTCTHAPEENEEVVQFLLDNYYIEIQDIKLPIKTRNGLTSWQGKQFNEDLKKAVRIYPQDNNTEGFFLCKIKKISENKKIKGDEK